MDQPNNTLTGSTAIVTGTSRGFGSGIADALTAAGARVVGIARSGGTVTADAADPATARRLIDEYQPRTVVLCAGAAPQMSPDRSRRGSPSARTGMSTSRRHSTGSATR